MWLKNLFGKNDNDEEKIDELELKMKSAIEKCEKDKRTAQKAVDEVKNWAADAIIETYADFFPNANLSYYRDKYKEDALEKYEQIKAEHGGKLEPDTVKKCDEVVAGYLNQIKLLHSKVELFDKLLNEHLKIKEKYDNLKAKNKKMDRLDKHDDRLKEMNEDAGTLASTYISGNELDEISKEFELKEAYHQELDKLNTQYGDDETIDNSLAYKEEVDKMIKKL